MLRLQWKRNTGRVLVKGVIAVSVVIVLCLSHSDGKSRAADKKKIQSRPSPVFSESLRSLSGTYSRLPLVFEPNRGQVDAQVQFMARGRDYTLYLTRDQAVVALHGAAPVTVRAAGAARPTKIEGLEPTGGLSNYLRGNDPSRWQIGIPHYRKVQYSSIYPGIDLTYYGNPQKLEYDFVVAAWANPNQIQVEYDGAESLAVDAHGDLIVKTAAGGLIPLKPRAFQGNFGERGEGGRRYLLVGR